MSPSINPAIVRHNKVMVETLQTAPRGEAELAKLIEQKKQELRRATKRDDTEQASNELDALEWLHALVVVSKISPLSAESVV